MAEFFSMGGYGAYVWSSFGLSGAVLAGCIVAPYLRLKRLRRELLQTEHEDELDT